MQMYKKDWRNNPECCLNCRDKECKQLGHACYECVCSKCYWYARPPWGQTEGGYCEWVEMKQDEAEEAYHRKWKPLEHNCEECRHFVGKACNEKGIVPIDTTSYNDCKEFKVNR